MRLIRTNRLIGGTLCAVDAAAVTNRGEVARPTDWAWFCVCLFFVAFSWSGPFEVFSVGHHMVVCFFILLSFTGPVVR